MTSSPGQTKRSIHRLQSGVVTSAGGDKTISVAVNELVRHPRYGKYIRRRTKLAVHDPQDSAVVGDIVEVTPCRPISKSKSWRLVRIVRSGNVEADVAAVGEEGANP